MNYPIKTSFEKVKSQGYADRYMMDTQLEHDHRKVAIDRVEQAIVHELLDALPAGSVVADVPCGNGRMTQLVTRPDLRLVALDFNRSMLAAMAGRDLGHNLARRAQANITALPLADQSVDLFINMRLLHHIYDHAMRVQLCRQIARVTRGRCVMSFWTTHCWRYLRKRLLQKKLRGCPIAPRQFVGVCREAGLQVERIIPVRPWYEDENIAICRPL